jgi:hypothetical protein
MATIVLPASADGSINEQSPDSVLNGVSIVVHSQSVNKDIRSLMRFDIGTLIDIRCMIDSAILSIYYSILYLHDPVGRTYYVNELTETGWVETEATWNSYETGSAWVAAGGDYVDSYQASATVPAAAGWMTWDITNIVKHCQTAHSSIVNLHIMDATEEADFTGYGAYLNSRTAALRQPKLTITYHPWVSNILMF